MDPFAGSRDVPCFHCSPVYEESGFRRTGRGKGNDFSLSHLWISVHDIFGSLPHSVGAFRASFASLWPPRFQRHIFAGHGQFRTVGLLFVLLLNTVTRGVLDHHFPARDWGDRLQPMGPLRQARISRRSSGNVRLARRLWLNSDVAQLDRSGHPRRLHRGSVAVDVAHVSVVWRRRTALCHAHSGKVLPGQSGPALSFAPDFPRLRRRWHSMPFSLHS